MKKLLILLLLLIPMQVDARTMINMGECKREGGACIV